MMDTSFFVGRVTIVAGKHSRLGAIRRQVFEAMHRNALAGDGVLPNSAEPGDRAWRAGRDVAAYDGIDDGLTPND